MIFYMVFVSDYQTKKKTRKKCIRMKPISICIRQENGAEAEPGGVPADTSGHQRTPAEQRWATGLGAKIHPTISCIYLAVSILFN